MLGPPILDPNCGRIVAQRSHFREAQRRSSLQLPIPIHLPRAKQGPSLCTQPGLLLPLIPPSLPPCFAGPNPLAMALVIGLLPLMRLQDPTCPIVRCPNDGPNHSPPAPDLSPYHTSHPALFLHLAGPLIVLTSIHPFQANVKRHVTLITP